MRTKDNVVKPIVTLPQKNLSRATIWIYLPQKWEISTHFVAPKLGFCYRRAPLVFENEKRENYSRSKKRKIYLMKGDKISVSVTSTIKNNSKHYPLDLPYKKGNI